MISLDALKSDESALRKELESAGAHFRGKVCKCPFHDDRTPSAGIYFKDGAWLFKCQGCGFGGDIIDVRAKLNKRTPAEELRAMNDAAAGPSTRKAPPPPPKIFSSIRAIASQFENLEDVYADLYADPVSGEQKFAVIRWRNREGKKCFTQCSVTAGGWWMKAPEGLLPIANRAAIAKAERVVVTEGEKCVRRLASVGIVATTSPGGALKGEHADWSPLAGKIAILWPDLDAPDDEFPEGKGVEHMRRVCRILQALSPAPTVLWFDPTPLELPVKGDAADVVDRYRESFSPEETKALIEDAMADAKSTGVVAEYEKELDAIIAGQRRAIDLPFERLSDAARALLPATVTCVCGDGGSGKSLFISEWVVGWNELKSLNDLFKINVAIFHLEDDRNYHLRRMHAQLAGMAEFTDNKWVEAHAAIIRESKDHYRVQLEELGRCIWESPQDDVSLEMLLTWIEARAKAGADVIIIDPVTAVQGASRPWVEDLKFITKAKWIGRRYGCRFVFITHPKGGTKGGRATHNDMAGGAAYPRFSHTVLWVERNDTESQFSVKASKESTAEYIVPNRIVSIQKARNGPGAGRKIAFNFNPQTLRFDELGTIQREAPPGNS